MFETLVRSGRSDLVKRFTSFLVSVVCHAVGVFVFVLIPLVFFNVLPANELLTFLTAPPPPPLPPAPRPVVREPVHVGGIVQQSKLIRRIEPEYPPMARMARVQGKVILQVIVDEEGNVTEVKVLEGNPLLNDGAVRAVRQWKYSPTLLNGEPVPVTASVTVIFKLTRQ
ncbi:MAG TPA: energy transducer TonB [Acidobacteriota bacterium]|nr:energy transducer TonB [Acidobacteriota bacterium]